MTKTKLGFGSLHSGIRILHMLLGSIPSILLLPAPLLLLLPLLFLLQPISATVILTTASNQSLPFSNMEAGFTPRVPQAGIVGLLSVANPLNACEPLRSGPVLDKSPFSTFVLVQRGVCTFEDKVRLAQDAGFSAVIIYNDEADRDLVIMSGNPVGIQIPAVFISRAAGMVLSEYAGDPQTRCYIFPTMDYPAWSVMAVAFISLLAVTAVLATFFFVRRHRLRRLGSRLLQREPPGLSDSEVKALPTFVFSASGDQVASPDTCVICMEEYEAGQKLRLLPCRHSFHAVCIDQWLLTRKPFCPVCKRDAHSKFEGPSMTETTPLLTAPPPRVPSVSSSATQTSPPASSASRSLSCSCSPISVPLSAAGLHRCSSLVSAAYSPRTSPGGRGAPSSWPRSSHAHELNC